MINPGLKCYEWPISILQEQIEMITLFIAPVSLLSLRSCRHQAVKAFPQLS